MALRSRVALTLRRPDHLEARWPQTLDQVGGAQPGEIELRAPRQSPGLRDQFADDHHEFVIRHFVMERIEQHGAEHSRFGLCE